MDWSKARKPAPEWLGRRPSGQLQAEAARFVANYDGPNQFVRQLKGRSISQGQARVVLRIRSEESEAWAHQYVKERLKTKG